MHSVPKLRSLSVVQFHPFLQVAIASVLSHTTAKSHDITSFFPSNDLMLPKSSNRIGTSIGDSLTKCHHLRLEQFMQLWNNSLHSNTIHLLVSLTEMNYESRPYSLKLQQPQSERKSHAHTNQARTNFSKAVRNILRSLMLKVKCTDATEIL